MGRFADTQVLYSATTPSDLSTQLRTAHQVAFGTAATGLQDPLHQQAVVGSSSAGNTPVGSANPAISRSDFNGDGQADVFWHHSLTGDTGIWLMRGGAPIQWVPMPTVNPIWRVEGAGDFNKDGKADILWRNTATGQVNLWLLNGTNLAQETNIGTACTLWNVAGTGDFNRDGNVDILWRSDTLGVNGIWLMNGTGIAQWAELPSVDANWRIEATGDFNQDGNVDIAWRCAPNGDVVLWLNNSTTVAGAAYLGSAALGWRIAGTGDFTQDGKTDLLLRNDRTGDIGFWGMNGTTVTSWTWMGSVDASWRNLSSDSSLAGSNSGNDWFSTNLRDTNLQALVRNLFADTQISRNDMLAIFQDVKDGGVVDANELTDLRTLVQNSTRLGMADFVRVLADKVVNGNGANQWYQGGTLGNLAANSSAVQLDKLVNKWFLGLDRPAVDSSGYTYQYISGSLFQNGISYLDVDQGAVGDCYFLAGLGMAALRNPNAIQSMFTDNGDGTFTVRFYNQGVADYVTVDRYLPTFFDRSVYARWGSSVANPANELWVALAEKAYAQMNESGWIYRWDNNHTNSYKGIEGGFTGYALSDITGRQTTVQTSLNFNTMVNVWQQGGMLGLNSKSSGQTATTVVPDHAYVVVGYNSATQKFTIYNPWGPNGGTYNGHITPGTLELSWNEIQASFRSWDYAV